MELWNTVPTEWKIDRDSNLMSAKCFKGCKCELIRYKSYKSPNRKYTNVCSPRRKAGVFMTSTDKKILIVQSRGRLWGVPKGGIEKGETEKECAFRELEEETGVSLDQTKVTLDGEISMNNGKYFCIANQPEYSVSLDDIYDSTGVGWISYDCLTYFIHHKLIRITSDFSRMIRIKRAEGAI